MLNGNLVYKSKIIFKNLNPEWNEEFCIKLLPSPLLTGVMSNSNSNETSSSNSNLVMINSQQLEMYLSKFRLKIFVYDYDRGVLSDDLIGYAEIDLTKLKDNM